MKYLLTMLLVSLLAACSGNSDSSDVSTSGGSGSGGSSGDGSSSSSSNSSSGSSSSGSGSSTSSSSGSSSSTSSSSGASNSSSSNSSGSTSSSSGSSSGPSQTSGIAAPAANNCVADTIPAAPVVNTAINFLPYSASNTASTKAVHRLDNSVANAELVAENASLQIMAPYTTVDNANLASRVETRIGSWWIDDEKIKVINSATGTLDQLSAVSELTLCPGLIKTYYPTSASAPELHFAYTHTTSCDSVAKIDASMSSADEAIPLPNTASVSGEGIYNAAGELQGFLVQENNKLIFYNRTFCLEKTDNDGMAFSEVDGYELFSLATNETAWSIHQHADSSLLIQIGDAVYYIHPTLLSNFLIGTYDTDPSSTAVDKIPPVTITGSIDHDVDERMALLVGASDIYFLSFSNSGTAKLFNGTRSEVGTSASLVVEFANNVQHVTNIFADANSIWMHVGELDNSTTTQNFYRWNVVGTSLDNVAEFELTATSSESYFINEILWVVNNDTLRAKLSPGNKVTYTDDELIRVKAISNNNLMYESKLLLLQSFDSDRATNVPVSVETNSGSTSIANLATALTKNNILTSAFDDQNYHQYGSNIAQLILSGTEGDVSSFELMPIKLNLASPAAAELVLPVVP